MVAFPPTPSILDKTLGKNSSFGIICHALTKYIRPYPSSLPPPPPPASLITNVVIMRQNTVQAFGRFFNQHWNVGGGGEAGRI